MAEKKKNESAIVKATADLMTIPLTAENVLKFIEPKATLQEVALFLNQCAMFQLNPFKREIYLIKYSSNDPASFVVAYDVYLKRAERSGKWAGMKTGVIRDVEGQIIYGWAEVYRKDWTIPLRHEVAFGEYVAMRDEWKDGKRTGKKVPTRFWTEKPETMIKKVAVAQAFRMAFPDELGGMPYIEEEISARIHGESGPTLEDIAKAAGVEPLKHVKDEFTDPEKFPVNGAPAPAKEPEIASSLVSLADIEVLAKKTFTLKELGLREALIFEGINRSLAKNGFPAIAELGDVTKDAFPSVCEYLDLWKADIIEKKEKKNGK
jgi:phage recombination protein Bet